MRLLATACVLIALGGALGGCGSNEVQVGAHDALAARGGAATRTQAAPEVDDGKRVPVERRAAAARKPAPDAPKPLPSGLEDFSDMRLEVILDRTCVTPGGTMSATAKTVKNAGLGFSTAYPDNSQAPDFTFVPREGNPTGTHTWTWVVRPTIPPGDALLVVTAYTAAGKSATFKHPFVIARAC